MIDCSLAPPTKEAKDASPSLKRSSAGAVATIDEPERRWSASTPVFDGTRPTGMDTTGAGQRTDDDECDVDDDDDWKDYSCATLWEYFVNDIDSAIGAIEDARDGGGARDGGTERTAAAAAAAIGSGRQDARSRRKRLAYNGRSYMLRRLHRGAIAVAEEEARV